MKSPASSIIYIQKVYIPEKLFDVDMYAKDIELNYFIDLLIRNNMLAPIVEYLL